MARVARNDDAVVFCCCWRCHGFVVMVTGFAPSVDVPRELVLPRLRAVAGDEGLQARQCGDGAFPVLEAIPIREQAVALEEQGCAELPQREVWLCRWLHLHGHIHVAAVAPLYSAIVNHPLRAEVVLNQDAGQ